MLNEISVFGRDFPRDISHSVCLSDVDKMTSTFHFKVNSIDLQTMKMQEKKSATHTRYEFASVAWLYDIYVIGGYSSQGDVDFVERYVFRLHHSKCTCVHFIHS